MVFTPPPLHAAFRAVLRAMAFASLLPGLAFAQGGAASSPALPHGMIAGLGLTLLDDQGPDRAALIIDLSGETGFRFEALQSPDRLVIDLDKVVFSGRTGRPIQKAIGPISGFRAGLFLLGQSRIVLDLARPALIERADFVQQNGAPRLVVQIRGVTPERFAEAAEQDGARRLARHVQPPPAAPVAGADERPLIVIDPGHGGIDPGALGLKGEAEKDIVLAFGRAMQARLAKSDKVRVELTREDDRFIALSERVGFARSRNAALFISLHADSLSGDPDVRGASVYTLSDRATDASAARAAEKENRVDLLAGLDADEESKGGVDSILNDLARRETRVFAQVIARDAVSAIRNAARVHKSPLRAAGFRVLRAPDVPSILVELGFLSSPDDMITLTDAQKRQKLADSLADAALRFVNAAREGSGGLATPE